MEALSQAVVAIQEVAHDLRRYQERLTADPQRLAEIESRLEFIARLKRKYGATVEEILAFAAAAQADLDSLTSSAERLAQLEEDLSRIDESSRRRPPALSLQGSGRARQPGDRRSPQGAATCQTPGLRSPSTSRRTRQASKSMGGGWRSPAGGSIASSFAFRPIPANRCGRSPRSLRVVRCPVFALAIKATMAEVDPASTLIFDEVDAGIGGQTAERVADALVELARTHQVLVVTHLAQIAARADRHMTVVKQETDDRTTVTVRVLEGEERIWEIARMLDGKATETSFDHAKALLEMARQAKTAS